MFLLWRSFSFFLLVADSSCFRLQISHFSKVKSYSSSTKRVHLRLPTALFVGCPETADQCIQASPRLTKRTGARARWVRVPVKRAHRCVDFSLPKLVKIPEKLEHVGATTSGKRKWWPVILQVLTEGIPVSALLVLVTAGSCGCRRRTRRRGC